MGPQRVRHYGRAEHIDERLPCTVQQFGTQNSFLRRPFRIYFQVKSKTPLSFSSRCNNPSSRAGIVDASGRLRRVRYREAESLQMVTAAMKLIPSWRKSYDQPRQHIKNQRHHFTNKVHLVKAMVFPGIMHGYESCTIKKAEL